MHQPRQHRDRERRVEPQHLERLHPERKRQDVRVPSQPVLPLPREHATAEDELVRDLRGLPPLVRVKLRGHEDRVEQAEDHDERDAPHGTPPRDDRDRRGQEPKPTPITKTNTQTKQKKQKKWRIGASIPVPLACEASDLPIDLIPQSGKSRTSQGWARTDTQ